jgi:hypothetical protein
LYDRNLEKLMLRLLMLHPHALKDGIVAYRYQDSSIMIAGSTGILHVLPYQECGFVVWTHDPARSSVEKLLEAPRDR